MFRIDSTSKLIRLVPFAIISAVTLSLSLSARAQEKKNTISRPQALPASISISDSNKERDGLIGPVRRVCTEAAKLSVKSGRLTEGTRALLNTAVYDLQGKSIENKHYLMAEPHRSVSKAEYNYDDKGNVTEMTLHDNHGAILSREVYTYEFDVVGNWNKMVTSLVIYEAGKLSYEPVEVAYRTISYYFNESMAKVKNSAWPQTTGSVVSSTSDTAKEAEVDGTLKGDVLVKADRAAPTARMAEPQPRLISGAADNSQLIMIPKTNYPDEAKRAGVTGTVAVSVEIDTKGQVVSARAVRGHSMLQAAAVEAALKARFAETMRANRTAKRSGLISFTFSLIQ